MTAEMRTGVLRHECQHEARPRQATKRFHEGTEGRRDEEVNGGAGRESVRTWQMCGAAMMDCRSVEMELGEATG